MATRTQLKWDTGHPAIQATDGEIVSYVEDINPDVIKGFINEWNKGVIMGDIESYLDKQIGVGILTTEEKEHLLEDVNDYITIANDPGKMAIANLPLTIPPGNILSENKEKKPSPLKGRMLGPKIVTSKKELSPEEMIEKLQEKITLINLIKDVGAHEYSIPSDIGKAARDMLIEYRKEQDLLKTKYLGLIQAL